MPENRGTNLSEVSEVFEEIVREQANQSIHESQVFISDDECNNTGKGLEIKVLYVISIDEFTSFVESVVDSMFVNDDYFPSLYNFAFASCILYYYTNIRVQVDNEIISDIIYKTEIYKLILEKINSNQLLHLKKAIKNKIELRKAKLFFEKENLLNENLDALTKATNIFSDIAQNLQNFDYNSLLKRTDEDEADKCLNKVLNI